MVQSFRRVWLLALGGTLVFVASCSGGGGGVAGSVSPVEESTVVVESLVPDSLVPNSLVSNVPARGAAQSTTAESGAQAERLTVAEAQVIVDDLNHKVGDAYRLAKQGDLGAARAKLAEAETGEILGLDTTELENPEALSRFVAEPVPVFQVVRLSDVTTSCLSLAGTEDLTGMFLDGQVRSRSANMTLKLTDSAWRIDFVSDSADNEDVLCPAAP